MRGYFIHNQVVLDAINTLAVYFEDVVSLDEAGLGCWQTFTHIVGYVGAFVLEGLEVEAVRIASVLALEAAESRQ
jgi:hypothetical protein